MERRRPLGAGSVSAGLTAVDGTGSAIVARLREESALAVASGFDGVTLSEHHGGFPGYVPAPLLLAGVLLAHLPQGWVAPCPAILPLRPVSSFVEDLAWLRASYPGRVAAGFVPGYQERDFDLAGADFASRRSEHWERLGRLVTALGGAAGGGLGDDPAVAECADAGVPVVSGIAGPIGAAKAARAGAGLLLMSLAPAEPAAELVKVYRDAGGGGPCVLIRRVWLGAASVEDRLAGWRSAATDAAWLDAAPDSLVTGGPDEVADRLLADLAVSGATALNVRLSADHATPDQIDDQIRGFGAEVIPRIHESIS